MVYLWIVYSQYEDGIRNYNEEHFYVNIQHVLDS
jgi:hypothetical protein